jgi:branched-chain amino acid transport system substrate-binding protein
VVSIISDFAPGAEASKVFEQHFTQGGGTVLDTIKVPLANPDFAPFLQRARDAQPDTRVRFLAGRTGGSIRQTIRRARA